MANISNQKGFSLIIAIVMLIIFGILAAMLTSLVTTDSDIAMYQARSGEALYIANAGQQYLMKQAELIYPNFYVSTKSLPPGSFTISPPTIVSTAMTATSPANGGSISVSDTTNFPPSGRILIDSELIDYAAKSAGSFDIITRARSGTLASAHAVDAGIYLATVLTVNRNSSDATIPVSSTTGFMIPGTIKIDQEFLYCTGIIGGFSGCTRGTQGSQAMAHNAGATAIQITATVTGTVPTGIIGDAKRVLRAQAGKYLDGWGVGGAVPITSDLNSVFCVTATNCWAVGTGGTIIQYISGTWGTVTSPTGEDLFGISCVSTTNCWAVGAGGTIVRYDGISWGNAASPTGEDLSAVHCVSATDCWAVGQRTGGRPTMLRWNSLCPGGTGSANSWNDCTADAPAINQDLRSVFLLDTDSNGLGDDGWAVGNRVAGGLNRPMMLRWNNNCGGTSSSTNVWTDCTASAPQTNRNLNSVFLSNANNGWAVGDPGVGPSQRPQILNWNGAAWSTANSNLNINETLNGVHCPGSDPNDCWTVGTTGTILHWNGTAWSVPPSPPPALLRWNGINWDNVSAPAGFAQSLNSISMLDIDLNGSSEDGWAVGDRIANTTSGWTFLRWNSPTAGTWNQITVTTAANAQNLNSVSMVSGSDGWAVGNRINGTTSGWTFLRWNSPTPATWNQITVTTAANAQNLNSVSMVSGSDGWAVGNRLGPANNQWTFLRWTGSWSQFTVTTGVAAQNLSSVFMLSATDGWAVGNSRGCANPGLTILRWDGASWTCPAGLPVVDQPLNSVYMISATDGWAVGNRRGCANPGLTILRWNGASWACPAGLPVVDQHLNSVYCNSSSDCWAKGNNGTILHWDGTSWSQYPSPTANALNEVFMIRPQNFLRLADWQEVY